MGEKLWLVAIFIILLLLPSALALNCTKYRGDQKKLCNILKYLPLTESYKRTLMKSDIYRVDSSSQVDDLSLNIENQKEITFSEIYDSKISLIVKIVLFILLIYLIYKILSKHYRSRYG